MKLYIHCSQPTHLKQNKNKILKINWIRNYMCLDKVIIKLPFNLIPSWFSDLISTLKVTCKGNDTESFIYLFSRIHSYYATSTTTTTTTTLASSFSFFFDFLSNIKIPTYRFKFHLDFFEYQFQLFKYAYKFLYLKKLSIFYWNSQNIS